MDFGLRAGYTLIEILLVLAIIVVLAAAVSPALRGTMRNVRLKAAANDVRTTLTQAHVKAMKTGRIHVFQYELGGGKYKLEPWIGDDDALESKDSDPNAALPAAPGNHEKSLPEETKFAAGDARVESRGQSIEQELTTSGSAGVTWSRPILFYPDGSSVDAFVVVGNEHNAGIRLDLRGMTSSVKVGELSDLKKLESDQPLSQ